VLPPSPAKQAPHAQNKRRRLISGAIAAFAAILMTALAAWLWGESPERVRERAEAAARRGDWTTALNNWRLINATKTANGLTHFREASACLALSRAGQAERALRMSTHNDPSDPEPWRLLLEILRVEDRTLEALHTGWEAYDKVRPDARPTLLRELTFSLLAEMPDEDMRTVLRRWINSDGDDVDARVALLQRIAVQPRATDPDRETLLAELELIVASHPGHITAREVLVTALADAGQRQRGRELLDKWPAAARDARYWRLRGRWDLEYDQRPLEAVEAFRSALAELPHDWRTWYRLSRALRVLGREEESRQAAEAVRRIREVLDPLVLGPRLSASVNHLDDASTLHDLATLSARAGLDRLAKAWLAESQLAAKKQ
jgi:tetratricopeptide (TPR) repeat protein